MRFIADGGVDAQIVIALRERENDVIYVAEFDAGASDEELLKLANRENRILLTRDKDFGELVFRLRKVHSGIILNRLYELDSSTKARLVLEVLEKYGDELLGSYTVIQPGRVRIRKIE